MIVFVIFAICRGDVIPFISFNFVLRNSMSLIVIHTKIKLSSPASLICGSMIPLGRFDISRHRNIQRASPSVPCCGRGRPHSAVNFVGDEVTRLISNPVLILQSETPHVVSYGFWHGVRPNGTTGNEPGARPSPGAATLPTKPSSKYPRRIAVRSLLRPGTAALRRQFCRSRGDETHFKPGLLIFQSETPHVVSYGFWHGVFSNRKRVSP